MQVLVGADYRGFELKEAILRYLATTEYDAVDRGTYDPKLEEGFNAPAVVVAQEVRENPASRGILICDSAHGMCIQANRFKDVRAANCDSPESAVLAREHDDANVLCLSAHFVSPELAQKIIEAFLATEFTPIERRMRRINLLDERTDYDWTQ